MFKIQHYTSKLLDGKLKVQKYINDNGKINKSNDTYNLKTLASKNADFDGDIIIKRTQADTFKPYSEIDEATERELDMQEFEHYRDVLKEAIKIMEIIAPDGYNNCAILPYVRKTHDAAMNCLNEFLNYKSED